MVALRADELLNETYLAEHYPGREDHGLGFEEISFAELADAPIEALAGISETNAARLRRTLGIHTIGDLGGHPAIVAAVAIAALAGTPRHKPPPGGLAARLAATRAEISGGRIFEPAADVINAVRNERLASL